MIRTLAAIGLAICIAAIAHEALADDLPRDPFRRCAVKALRGDFGPLKMWQLDAYRRGLQLGVTANVRLLVTAYWTGEAGGDRDRYGNTCTDRTAASNELPPHSYVWTRFGLRQILDCGAASNTHRAKRAGCDAWVDYHFKSARAAQRAGCGGWTPTRGAVIP